MGGRGIVWFDGWMVELMDGWMNVWMKDCWMDG